MFFSAPSVVNRFLVLAVAKNWFFSAFSAVKLVLVLIKGRLSFAPFASLR